MKSATAIRRAALVAGAAALALTLGACTSDDPTGGGSGGGEGSGDLTPVTIGTVFTTAAVPIWVAEEEGIFEKYGLDATIQQAPNFAASAPSLLSGQMEFANAATTPIITAIDEGMPLQIVAGVLTETGDPKGGNQVIVPADSDIQRPKDLEGKKMAINAIGSGPYVGLMANYAADGGAPDGIEWVVMGFTEQIAALEAGEVDAIIGSEPFTSQALAAGFKNAFNPYIVDGLDLFPPGFTDAVLVASQEYLANNAEVGDKMRDAMIEANQWANDNPDAVREMLVSYLDMDEDVASTVTLPTFNGEVKVDDIQSVIDAMTSIDMTKNELDANEIVWLP